MRISINTPEIAELRAAIESSLGFPVKTPRHFTALSLDVELKVSEHLSETTLQRLWLYKKGYDTVALQTLDILCKYCGYSNWHLFCNQSAKVNVVESEMFAGDCINVNELRIGTLIKIGWNPDRMCIIKYLGNLRFEALETHNSKLCAGDRFSCLQLQLGKELYLDNLVHDNSDMRYVAGSRNGLTILEVLGSNEV